MKKIIIFSFFASGLIFYACKKNTISVAKFDLATESAFFKLNYSSPYALNPAVQIKIDGIRVSNNITYSTPFPGGGLNTGGSSNADYLSLPPGEHTVSVSIPKAKTNIDSISLYSIKVDLKKEVYQTLHITDTLANTKSIMFTDASNKPDTGASVFKFINLIPDSKMDLYFGTRLLATGIDYLQSSDTFSVVASTTGKWAIRKTGSLPGSTPLYAYPVASSSNYTILNQRAMTVYARGFTTIGGTTDVRRPQLSLLFNK